MTDINKQKFLAELGKLLTFMYEEDRQSALAMYAKLFDNARDEQSLLQFLVSPTRQAVLIARAYNARERKLQVSSQSRSSDYKEEGTPGYVSMIGKLESEAIEKKIITPEVSTDQFTLFADGVHPVEEGEASAPAAQAEAVSEETPAADTAAVTAPEAVDESDTELEIVEPDSADEPELTPEADAEPEETPVENEPENTPVEAEAESGDVSADADDADKAKTTEADELPISNDDEVDDFLADFSIADELITDSDENESPAKEQPAPAPEAPETKSKPDLDWNIPVNPPSFVDSDQSEIFDMTERQPIIPLLILYIIIAIPVALLCILILLIPALLALALAISAVVLGCAALSSAFGAFTMFSDILVVLGASLAALALGLLFLWLFVWFIAGAIAGLISGIIKLGGKLCYREVSIE